MAKKYSVSTQVVGALALIVTVGWFLAPGQATEKRPEQVGYFKSEDRQRVFSYRVEPGFDAEDAAALLDQLTWTEGRLTVAVVYAADAVAVPVNELTLADGVADALVLISNPPFDEWLYRLTINANGDRSLKKR